MPNNSAALLQAATVVAALEQFDGAFERMESSELRRAVAQIAQLRQHVDQVAASAASEVARRSRRELGHQGLAQKAGFVSPVAMLQAEAQVSKHEATRLIEMGTMLARAEASERHIGAAASGWHSVLANAVTDGHLSFDKVDAIRRVMAEITVGSPAADGNVFTAALTDAVRELVASAPHLTSEQLFRHARRARDLIDADGIARREKQQFDLRSMRTWWDTTTGMHCGSWRLAPEDGALVAEAFEQILSPRRGGPRFVRADEKKTAEQLIADPRTDEQISADAFTAMIRLAVDADPGTLFGTRRPAVRAVVTADQLQSKDGPGHLEARHEPVSATTVDRLLCDTGVVSIGFDTDGHCVNVGRDQRLFTSRQRIGLAARDGGCRFPGCDRPPSYSEAHHINPWKAKGGKTDVNDGILLCSQHHLLIHNNRWNVSHSGATYWLTPPPDVDPNQIPILMPTKSPVLAVSPRSEKRA